MTENRKRVSVTIAGQQRCATIRAPAQAAGKTVTVAALPVRPLERPAYAGPYAVDPLFTGQTLQTNGKRMTDDLTVEPIYVSDTQNPAGGITVYIGGEFING